MTRKEYCCMFLANKEYFDMKSTAQRNEIFELEFPFYCTSTSFSLIKILMESILHKDQEMSPII